MVRKHKGNRSNMRQRARGKNRTLDMKRARNRDFDEEDLLYDYQRDNQREQFESYDMDDPVVIKAREVQVGRVPKGKLAQTTDGGTRVVDAALRKNKSETWDDYRERVASSAFASNNKEMKRRGERRTFAQEKSGIIQDFVEDFLHLKFTERALGAGGLGILTRRGKRAIRLLADNEALYFPDWHENGTIGLRGRFKKLPSVPLDQLHDTLMSLFRAELHEAALAYQNRSSSSVPVAPVITQVQALPEVMSGMYFDRFDLSNFLEGFDFSDFIPEHTGIVTQLLGELYVLSQVPSESRLKAAGALMVTRKSETHTDYVIHLAQYAGMYGLLRAFQKDVETMEEAKDPSCVETRAQSFSDYLGDAGPLSRANIASALIALVGAVYALKTLPRHDKGLSGVVFKLISRWANLGPITSVEDALYMIGTRLPLLIAAVSFAIRFKTLAHIFVSAAGPEYSRFVELRSAFEQHKIGAYPNSYFDSAEDFESDLRKFETQIQAGFQASSGKYCNEWRQVVAELQAMISYINNDRKNRQRVMPFSIAFYGSPGQGKTVMMHMLGDYLFERRYGSAPGKDQKWTYNPHDAFDSGASCAVKIVYINDIGNAKATQGVTMENPASFVQRIVDNEQYAANMADLPSKGTVVLEPEYVISSMNKLDWINQFSTAPGSIARRFHLFVEVEVKDEWKKNGILDIDRVREYKGQLPPAFNIRIKQAQIDNRQGYTLRPLEHNLADGSVISFFRLCEEMAGVHHERQLRMMTQQKSVVDLDTETLLHQGIDPWVRDLPSNQDDSGSGETKDADAAVRAEAQSYPGIEPATRVLAAGRRACGRAVETATSWFDYIRRARFDPRTAYTVEHSPSYSVFLVIRLLARAHPTGDQLYRYLSFAALIGALSGHPWIFLTFFAIYMALTSAAKAVYEDIRGSAYTWAMMSSGVAFATAVATVTFAWVSLRSKEKKRGEPALGMHQGLPEVMNLSSTVDFNPLLCPEVARTTSHDALVGMTRLRPKLVEMTVVGKDSTRNFRLVLTPICHKLYASNVHSLHGMAIRPTDELHLTVFGCSSGSQRHTIHGRDIVYLEKKTSDIFFMKVDLGSEKDLTPYFMPREWVRQLRRRAHTSTSTSMTVIRARPGFDRLDSHHFSDIEGSEIVGLQTQLRYADGQLAPVMHMLATRFTAETRPGDCGVPVIVTVGIRDAASSTIAGLFSGVADTRHGRVGTVAPIDRESVLKAKDHFFPVSVSQSTGGLIGLQAGRHLNPQARHPILNTSGYEGIVSQGVIQISSGSQQGINPVSNPTMRSNLRHSPFHDDIELDRLLGPLEHKLPPPLNSTTHFTATLERLASQPTNIDAVALAAARDDLSASMTQWAEGAGVLRPLTIAEALNGTTTSKGLPLSTSAGPGFPGIKHNHVRGLCAQPGCTGGCSEDGPPLVHLGQPQSIPEGAVQSLPKFDTYARSCLAYGDLRLDVPLYYPSEAVLSVMDQIEHAIIAGLADFAWFRAVPKDEPRAKSKQVARIFWVGSLPFNLLLRMYLKPLLDALLLGEVEHGIGVNPLGPSWEALMARFDNAADSRRGAIDYKAFDNSIHNALKEMVNDCLVALALKCGYTERAITILRGLLRALLFIQYEMLGEVFVATKGGMPSGVYGIAEYNSLVNMGLHRYAFYRINPDLTRVANTGEFRRHVILVCYGDDANQAKRAGSTANRLTNFVLRDAAADFGMKVTPADKKGELTEFTDNVDFLKCTTVFVPRLSRRVGVIALSSIRKSLAFERKLAMEKIARISTARSALRLYWPHCHENPEQFEELRSHLVSALQSSTGINPAMHALPDFETIERSLLDGSIENDISDDVEIVDAWDI